MPELRPSEILLSADQIQKRVEALALEIRADFPDDLHVIAVLKGAFMFLSDLVRHTPGHVSMDFMAVSSYAKGTTTSGEVRLLKDLDTTLDGRNVVIVEDIVDTGLTLTYLQDILRARNPKSLRTACLLSKPTRRQVDVKVEYIGFTIEDRFVVGYGLDYAEQYRNLLYAVPAAESVPLQRPTAALTFAASRFASAMTAARSSVRSRRSFISTLPFTIVVRTSSPRVA
jgi:hypoxanthine phosphoribosyltransferase